MSGTSYFFADHMWRKLFIMSMIWLGLTSAALSQTISNPVVGVPPSAISATVTGQSFKATLTGQVNKIRVKSQAAVTNTLLIYSGASGSVVPGIGSPAYSQAGVALANAGSLVWQDITLSTPFPVVADASYTFLLDGGASMGALFFNTSNTYADGALFSGYNFQIVGFDLAFEVFEVATPAPAPVPTLSEWAMITFAMLIVGFGIYQQRRRQS